MLQASSSAAHNSQNNVHGGDLMMQDVDDFDVDAAPTTVTAPNENPESSKQSGSRSMSLGKPRFSIGDGKMAEVVEDEIEKKKVARPKQNTNVILKADTNDIVDYTKASTTMNLIMAIAGLISIIASMILLERHFVVEYDDSGIVTYARYEHRRAHRDLVSQGLKALTSLCTIVIIVTLWFYYSRLLDLDAKLYKVTRISLFQSEYLWIFLFEVLVNLFHAPPFLSWVDKKDRPFLMDKVAVFTVMRLYLWLRVYRDHSDIYVQRRWILLTMFIKYNTNINLAGLEFTTSLSFKHYFHRRPWSFFLWVTLFSVLVSCYCTYIAERVDNPQNFTTYQNILYYVGVTMTTIGYGDISPITRWGRIFAILAGVVGITLAALLLTTLLNYIQFSPAERHASNLVISRKYREKVERASGALKALGYTTDRLAVEWTRVAPSDGNDNTQKVYQDKCYCCTSGICGLGANDAVKHESNRITLLKSRRQGINQGVGMVTTGDQLNLCAEKLKQVDEALDKYGESLINGTNMDLFEDEEKHVISPRLTQRTEDDAKDSEVTEEANSSVPLQTFASKADAQGADDENEQVKANVARAIMFGTDEENVRSTVADPELLLLTDEQVLAYDKAIMRLDKILALLAAISIILVVLLLESGWNGDRYRHNIAISEIYKAASSVVTVLLLIVLYAYYAEEVRHDCIKYNQLGKSPPISIWTSDRLWLFLFEAAICAIHAPPGLDTVLGDKFAILTLVRFYLFVRLMRDLSYSYQVRTWVLKTGKFRQAGMPVRFGWIFSGKHVFKNSPWIVTIVSLVASVIVSAYLMYIMERERYWEEGEPDSHLDLRYFSNIVYFVCVTMSTVGYGDMSAITSYGRSSAMLVAIVGLVLSAILVTAVIASIEMTGNERMASAMINARGHEHKVKHEAALLLQTWWHICKYKKDKTFAGFLKPHFYKNEEDVDELCKFELVKKIRNINAASRQAMEAQKDSQDVEVAVSQLSRKVDKIDGMLRKLLKKKQVRRGE